MTNKIKETLKLALEFNKRFISMNSIDVPERISVPREEWRTLFVAIQEALEEQPAQQGITLDGMTANEFALAELYAFQEATGCDTADQLKAQPQQEPETCANCKHNVYPYRNCDACTVQFDDPTTSNWEPKDEKPAQAADESRTRCSTLALLDGEQLRQRKRHAISCVGTLMGATFKNKRTNRMETTCAWHCAYRLH